jgi:RNA polymerase sigma-70 factor (sigma-E family)
MDLLGSATARADFEHFVSASTAPLLRAGYLMTWDLSETEDLVQETFVRVAKHWQRVRGMEHPLAYARRILVNLTLDDGERRSRRTRELSLPTGAVPDRGDAAATSALSDVEERSQLRDALTGLPRQERAVLVLRYWEDLSERDVARILGCSVGTVKKTAWRGLGRLRDALALGDPDATSRARTLTSTAERTI